MLGSIQYSIFDPQSSFLRWIAQSRFGFTGSHRVRFYNKLAKLLRNGIQLEQGVADLQKRAARKSKTDVQNVALVEILKRIRGGSGIHDAMLNYASTNELMILESGERSGDVAGAMDLAAEILQASQQMKKQVRGAIIQPIFLLAMLFVVIFAVSHVVMPKLTSVLDPTEWDSLAYALYLVTQFVNTPWFFLGLVLIIAGFVGVALSLPLWTGKGREHFDKIPPWSMFRLLIGSGWILSLSSLVRSGETIFHALTRMRDIAAKGHNRWLHDRLSKTIFYFSSGYNLGQALEATGTDFPDRELVDDLVIYSELSGFDRILYGLGREWVDNGMERIKQQSSVLNTAAIVFIGAVLGWFTYAVVSIQMSMGSHFSGMGGF